jgi:diguanylate cyclase (GGDEF)-like protein
MRLAYVQSPQEQLKLHRQAMELLKELKANVNPINYHLAYEYFVGEHTAFVAEINEMKANNQVWSDMLAVRLTEKYFKAHEREIVACEQELVAIVSAMSENVTKQVDEHIQIAQDLDARPQDARIHSARLKKSNRKLQHIIKNSGENIKSLRARSNNLKKKVMTDLLTRLNNETHLREFLPDLIARNRNTGKQIVMGLMDVVGFGLYNKDYGHLIADNLLRTYARFFTAIGEGSATWRTGADEFLVVIVSDDVNKSIDLLQKLHEQLSKIQLKLKDESKPRMRVAPVSMVAANVTQLEALDAINFMYAQLKRVEAGSFARKEAVRFARKE